jgi:hypothetical protein
VQNIFLAACVLSLEFRGTHMIGVTVNEMEVDSAGFAAFRLGVPPPAETANLFASL